jgi:hypothetical protein
MISPAMSRAAARAVQGLAPAKRIQVVQAAVEASDDQDFARRAQALGVEVTL